MKVLSPAHPSVVLSLADNPLAFELVLEAFSLQTTPPAELLIVDDGSDDQTIVILERWSPHLSFPVHRFSHHGSFSKPHQLNRAVRAARGDYLIFLDGDCLPHRRFVADHLRHARPGTFIQGRCSGIRARFVRRVSPRHFHPLYLFLRGWLYGLRRGFRRPWAVLRFNDRRGIQSCNFSVWRDDFFRVNGFDQSFVGHGHEASELAERLINAGLTSLTVIGQAIVYHLDHRRVARYRMAVNERILARTRREKRTRCDDGVAERFLATP